MEFSKKFDKDKPRWSIVYVEGLYVMNYFFYIFLSLRIHFVLGNIADPDEMPRCIKWHFIWVFNVLNSTLLVGSRPQRVTRLTLPLAIVAICYKDCRVATNTSHSLKVHSRWLKNYISAKKCILISFWIF